MWGDLYGTLEARFEAMKRRILASYADRIDRIHVNYVAAKFRHPVVFTTTALDLARTETSEPKITSCFIYVFHITVDSHKNVPWSTISLQVTQNDRSQSYLY